ncbi:MAG: winged helix-turn-helix domain-containing protein [Tannerella sp.]|jgi:hypothetical protein|nr:winged helix-turn-helix domain-containing protein [Tannerella sp.]
MIKNLIGKDAGIIWQLLFNKGMLSIKEIEKHLGMDSLNLTLALGWLARENKVRFSKKNGMLAVELINLPTDIYY